MSSAINQKYLILQHQRSSINIFHLLSQPPNGGTTNKENVLSFAIHWEITELKKLSVKTHSTVSYTFGKWKKGKFSLDWESDATYTPWGWSTGGIPAFIWTFSLTAFILWAAYGVCQGLAIPLKLQTISPLHSPGTLKSGRNWLNSVWKA